jgi:hypothetical protein
MGFRVRLELEGGIKLLFHTLRNATACSGIVGNSIIFHFRSGGDGGKRQTDERHTKIKTPFFLL